jgi:hypothetical protein
MIYSMCSFVSGFLGSTQYFAVHPCYLLCWYFYYFKFLGVFQHRNISQFTHWTINRHLRCVQIWTNIIIIIHILCKSYFYKSLVLNISCFLNIHLTIEFLSHEEGVHISHFLWLWQNNWENQLQRRKMYFGSWLQRFQSQLASCFWACGEAE